VVAEPDEAGDAGAPVAPPVALLVATTLVAGAVNEAVEASFGPLQATAAPITRT
jgi:hypothetical protein